MDRSAEIWLRRTATKEHWRVRGTCDVAELVQDGFLIYHRITLRYPQATAPHAMALFQTAFGRYLVDLSRKASRRPDVALAADLDIDMTLIPQDEPAPDLDTAPECVRELVDAAAKRLHRLRMPRRCSPDGTREQEHEWLSRVLGYSVPPDA